MVNWMTMKDESHTHQRWFDYLSKFNFEVVFRPGRLNTNADALSRLPPDELGLQQPDEKLLHIGHGPGFMFDPHNPLGSEFQQLETAQIDGSCEIMTYFVQRPAQLIGPLGISKIGVYAPTTETRLQSTNPPLLATVYTSISRPPQA